MIIEGYVLIAETGKALRRKGVLSRTMITRVSLSPSDSPDNWEDCDYGEPSRDEATEADKDAALRRFGVEVDK